MLCTVYLYTFLLRHNFDPFPFPHQCSNVNMAGVAMLSPWWNPTGTVSRWGNKLLWGYDTKQAEFRRGSRCFFIQCSSCQLLSHHELPINLHHFPIIFPISPLIFLWTPHLSVQDATLKDVFQTFTANGANWFDTGDSYGTGELEGAIGCGIGGASCSSWPWLLLTLW